MEYILRLLQLGLLLAVWIGGIFLASFWSRLLAIMLLLLGVAIFFWLRYKGISLWPKTERPSSPLEQEKEARYIVTQLLGNLTRVQVAYLCQNFSGQKEARKWLEKTLPSGFSEGFDDLFHAMETARMGAEVPTLKLAQRIVARRQELLDLEDRLKLASAAHPGIALAHPVFLIDTSQMATKQVADLPIILVASWNVEESTLIPKVELLNFVTPLENGRHSRGAAAFGQTRKILATEIKRTEECENIYLAQALNFDPVARGLTLDHVPVGFVIGTAEML